MSALQAHFAILLAGTLLDRLVGDPDRLWRRMPHPVVLIGRAIDVLDRSLNRHELSDREKRRNGILAVAALLAAAILAGWALHGVLARFGVFGWLLEAAVLAVFLAQKSLAEHVERVAQALRSGGLFAGRRTVAMIVGRDPEQLDEAGVCRAAIESLAENASDGIVAPFLAFLFFGLPGLFAYKALNTADSMIGHMSERHRAFGWAAARLDDVANWPAARLTALLFALAAALKGGAPAFARSWRVARRDAPSHRSPNAGWPESAAAAALCLSLGGPRRYGDLVVDAEILNAQGRRAATPDDIERAIELFRTVTNMLAATAALLLLAAGL